ncbi:MAG: UDP-2,3-diacylglucosamine diphosphatase LpxI [Pseudomonadota bacterium]
MGRWRKLGIIAGGGALPLRIAAACKERGEDFHVIRLTGHVDASPAELPGDDCAIGEAGKILRLMKAYECDAIVFAGLVKRPDFKSLKVDWRGAAMLPRIVAAATRGDGAILDALIQSVESDGFVVVGVEEAVESLLASAGALGEIAPDAQDLNDIRKAALVITALGPFDVGQGAVVAAGLVLAIEAAEGTDAMLARCAILPNDISGGDHSGVLVKRPKPGQELRVDLPTIGPETVRRAAEAGLKGIAVNANAALIIDRDEVVKLANEHKLFVYGFLDSEVAAL